MRKIVSGFAASVDGYIEGPHGEYDWILIDKEINFAESMKRFDTFLYGRRSYEAVVKMGGSSSSRIANYVFSTTLHAVHKNFRLVSSNIGDKIIELKKQPGKDIAVFGGASLLASLLNLRLVDELAISFIPVLLGKGKSMVDVLQDKVWLSFLSSKTYGNGTVQVTYGVKYDL